MNEGLADDIADALKGCTKRADQVAAMVKFIEGCLDLEAVKTAWPHMTYVEVEHVQAYGLEIGLDANGDACRVEFPYGASVQ